MRLTRARKSGDDAVVDRHDDHADQETAPERDDPLGPVLGKEDDLVAFAETGRMQPRREAARGASHLLIAERRSRKPSSWTRKSPRARGEVVEEVDERVARHG